MEEKGSESAPVADQPGLGGVGGGEGGAEGTDLVVAGEAGPSEEEIALRAYEISQSDEAGGPEADWYRAEGELRAGRQPGP